MHTNRAASLCWLAVLELKLATHSQFYKDFDCWCSLCAVWQIKASKLFIWKKVTANQRKGQILHHSLILLLLLILGWQHLKLHHLLESIKMTVPNCGNSISRTSVQTGRRRRPLLPDAEAWCCFLPFFSVQKKPDLTETNLENMLSVHITCALMAQWKQYIVL